MAIPPYINKTYTVYINGIVFIKYVPGFVPGFNLGVYINQIVHISEQR